MSAEIYRVFGKHIEGYADMLLIRQYEEFVLLKRLEDDKIIKVEKNFFERLPKRRIDVK